MSAPVLEIRGGHRGTAAAIEDLWAAGGRLTDAAIRLADVAARLPTRLADPAVAAAVHAPGTGGRAAVAAAACLGPRGPGGVAGLLAADAVAVRAAAAGYAAAEAAAAAAVAGIGWTAGRTGTWLPAVAVPLGASVLALGDGPAADVARRWLAGPAGSAAVGLTAAALPSGVRGALGLPWPGAAVPEVCRLVVTAARPAGLLREGAVRVTPARRAAAGPGHAPAGVADLVVMTERATARRRHGGGAEPGTVRVVRVRRPAADGGTSTAWIVHVPGTQDWAADAPPGATPFDLTGNVHLVAGGATAGTAAVAAAMAAAGVRPDEPVLLVGHSQGGLVATGVAADAGIRRRYTVSHVVTVGAPVAHAAVPDDVRVLSLEHTDDLVTRLDGRANPDRRTWLTVRAPSPPGGTGPLPPHDSGGYAVTAGLVDASGDPDLVAYRRSLAPFLDGPGAEVHAVDVRAERSGPPAAPHVRPGW